MCPKKCILYIILVILIICLITKIITITKEHFTDNDDNYLESDNQDIEEEPTEEVDDGAFNVFDNNDYVDLDDNLAPIENEDKGILETVKDKIADTYSKITSSLTENPAEDSTNIEGKQEDITIIPKFYDAESNTMMDSAKMVNGIPMYSPWRKAIFSSNMDSSYMISLSDDPNSNQDEGSMRFTRRSPACCSAQYPLPFKLNVSNEIYENKDGLVDNYYMGNSAQDSSGCACANKYDIEQLATRGKNA